MISFEVTIRAELLGLVLTLGMVLAALYAVLLSTERGREVCDRRTHWTVVGGHLLMALTMCFVSAPMAGLWLLWSVAYGIPLIVRSELQLWGWEDARDRVVEAALRGVFRGGRCDEGEAGAGDRSDRDRYGEAGAGDPGPGGPGGAGASGSAA